jgi:hypothetical protein
MTSGIISIDDFFKLLNDKGNQAKASFNGVIRGKYLNEHAWEESFFQYRGEIKIKKTDNSQIEILQNADKGFVFKLRMNYQNDNSIRRISEMVKNVEYRGISINPVIPTNNVYQIFPLNSISKHNV